MIAPLRDGARSKPIARLRAGANLSGKDSDAHLPEQAPDGRPRAEAEPRHHVSSGHARSAAPAPGRTPGEAPGARAVSGLEQEEQKGRLGGERPGVMHPGPFGARAIRFEG